MGAAMVIPPPMACEADDVAGAVDYRLTRIDVNGQKIGGLGISLGAQAALRGALKTYSLRSLVLEGTGSRDIERSRRQASISSALGQLSVQPDQLSCLRIYDRMQRYQRGRNHR